VDRMTFRGKNGRAGFKCSRSFPRSSIIQHGERTTKERNNTDENQVLNHERSGEGAFTKSKATKTGSRRILPCEKLECIKKIQKEQQTFTVQNRLLGYWEGDKGPWATNVNQRKWETAIMKNTKREKEIKKGGSKLKRLVEVQNGFYQRPR